MIRESSFIIEREKPLLLIKINISRQVILFNCKRSEIDVHERQHQSIILLEGSRIIIAVASEFEFLFQTVSKLNFTKPRGEGCHEGWVW